MADLPTKIIGRFRIEEPAQIASEPFDPDYVPPGEPIKAGRRSRLLSANYRPGVSRNFGCIIPDMTRPRASARKPANGKWTPLFRCRKPTRTRTTAR